MMNRDSRFVLVVLGVAIVLCGIAGWIRFSRTDASAGPSSATRAEPPPPIASAAPAAGRPVDSLLVKLESTGTTTIATTSAASTKPAPGIIRIAAGRDKAFEDAAGSFWQAESGFMGGNTLVREGIPIADTRAPEIYRGEHYGMEAFTTTLPNGRYMVRLHFAETYEGITGAGGRVFSIDVQGHQLPDFDIWKKAGGSFKAYVETVNNVIVRDGTLKITFTPKFENPTISGIEIIPAEALPVPPRSPLP